MKFRVTMKDPDTLHDACKEAAQESLRDLAIDEDELESLVEQRQEKLLQFAGRWMEYSEYVTIEFDTDAKTATVVPKEN